MATQQQQRGNGRPLPKFGEWDVNDPASAEGFTVIFNKARDEKKTGGNSKNGAMALPPKYADLKQSHESKYSKKSKWWFCCG
ncbi:protein NOI4-like isoform X2 [Humulus lupulus]|uniref:protein NOI4-like isoform X2 n=1 Tax=Humulus lupulus TaxID=3486 RepID=UPI002B41227E|nr:protein NOI4-like isoform X2 [Humulus lupulus]